MSVLKSILLIILISHYVPVNCQDPNPCQRVRNGKVRHPTSCTKYYECANYRAKQQTCKSTEHYSTKARGCVPIHESTCVITTTPIPTTQAPATTTSNYGSETETVTGSEAGSGYVSVSGSLFPNGTVSESGSESTPATTTSNYGSKTETVTGSEAGSGYVSGSLFANGSASESGSEPTCTPNEESLTLFNKYEYLGKTYYLSNRTEVTDTASAAVCESLCGYRVEVNDKLEEEAIAQNVVDKSVRAILVGGTDKFQDRIWEFERSRIKMKYINWCRGQPNYNQVIQEHCIAFVYKDKCMHDVPCQKDWYTNGYMCESY